MGLSFGVTPRKFPLVEYVQEAELLYQRLEEAGDSEFVQKARFAHDLFFQHLKQSYKMAMQSNLTPAQQKIINALKEDNSIIICSVNKGKVVVVEDRETYLMKLKIRLVKVIMSY